jgi:MFS transporter, Spinster family, sphingosine-1-phosphate transporter
VKKQIKPQFLLLILTGLNLLNYIDRFVLASLLESVSKHFSLTDSDAGSLATAFVFGYFLTSPFFGYLGDKYPRKWLIAIGIFVWSLATVMSGFANSYNQLLLCRILVGVGEASYASVSPSLISDAFPPEKRNNALTIFYVAIPLGAAIGTLFGSWVGAHYGWHMAFLWAGAPGLLLAFTLIPFAEPGRDTGLGQTGSGHSIPKLKDVLSLVYIREFHLVIWGYVAYTFALGAYQYWGQAFLQRIHNYEQTAAGNFFGGVMVVTGILGTFIGGWLSTRAQKKRKGGYALIMGIAVLIALPFTILFTLSDSILVFKISLAAAMFLLLFPTGPVNTVILEAVPSNLRSSAMAMSIFAIHAFGDLWSPTLVGKVSDATSNLRFGMLILAPALLICASLWLYLARFQKNIQESN